MDLFKTLGKVLFNDYVVPFEISSVLFLSAMVGAVVLGKRESRSNDEVTKVANAGTNAEKLNVQSANVE